MIKQLTEKNRAAMPLYVRRWIDIGLSTAPAERATAEQAVAQAYEAAGLQPPKRIVWCGSPLAMLAAAGADANDEQQARAAYDALIAGKPLAPVAGPYDCFFGQHEASWLSFYDYMRGELGLIEQTDKLQGLTSLAQSAGWIAPYERICYISERMSICSRDAAGRLHSVTGPAVAYPDGFSIYAVNGTRVPRDWVERVGELDPRRALTEKNVEQRAAIATLVGWHRVMVHLAPRVIDERRLSMSELLAAVERGEHDVGRLLEADLPDIGAVRFLEVLCPAHPGEPRLIPVPTTCSTALEASRWTYREDAGEEYLAPEGRA